LTGVRTLFRQFKEFAGLGGDATYLWPRWIVLRAVGLVYILIFAGIIGASQALIGPHGIAPVADLFARTQKAYPGSIEPFILAPGLFWISPGQGMIVALEWLGLAAAIALVLNLWPRMALFVCWLVFLSFVSSWGLFSPAQLDDLMLEVALICIPFAPAGYRPGLGAASPPRPVAVFIMRWLVFRIMFEDGLIKFIAGDPHWRNFTAMDIMYETAPFPTILGFLDHQMPHVYHVFEYGFTFVAEFAAPLLAVFAGRRGRWFAFWVWLAFQAGIELTCNFGWLNVASIAMGVLLLDDQMLQGFAAALRRRAGRRVPATPKVDAASPPRSSSVRGRQAASVFLKTWSLRAAFALYFYLTLVYFLTFVRIVRGLPLDGVPSVISGPRDLFWNFHSANEYKLYARFDPVRYGVEFSGSNDAGRTWRPYEYRYICQRVDQICPFIAPWFPRFEATLEGTDTGTGKAPLFQAVAAQLLARNPEVIGLFPVDPFPDRPPTLMRMRYYQLSFTDFAAWRRNGHFWRKEYKGDYLPMLYVNEDGRLAESDLAAGDAALKQGNYPAALATYGRLYQVGDPAAGFRLANLLAHGLGTGKSPAQSFAIYTELAARGEFEAGNNLGLCYEYASGVPVDYAKAAAWYRTAAEHESLIALYNLGALYAKGRIAPPDDIEGLTLIREASDRAVGADALARYIRQDPSGYAKKLEDRLTPAEIAQAELQASQRIKADEPLGSADSSP